MADVTVLSALTDIGYLPATKEVSAKDPDLYVKWLEIYKALHNPLLFFTDKVSTAERIMEIRRDHAQPTIVSLIIVETNLELCAQCGSDSASDTP